MIKHNPLFAEVQTENVLRRLKLTTDKFANIGLGNILLSSPLNNIAEQMRAIDIARQSVTRLVPETNFGIPAIAAITSSIGIHEKLWKTIAAQTDSLLLAQSAVTWKHCMFRALDHLENISALSSPAYLQSLLEPQHTFTRFVNNSRRKLASLEPHSQSRQSAIEGSIVLANTQLLESTETLTRIDEIEEDNQDSLHAGRLNLFYVQQKELMLLDQDLSGANYAELLNRSDSATAAYISHQIRSSVIRCNECIPGTDIIFDYTNKSVTSLIDFPLIISTNIAMFNYFISCLYCIFYEGAGYNLRFLKKNAGVLTDEECTFIWSLKTLRNKWLNHDIEHGSPSEIRHSKEQLRAELSRLGLSHMPRSSADFKLLQRSILWEAKCFVELLEQRLTERDGSVAQ